MGSRGNIVVTGDDHDEYCKINIKAEPCWLEHASTEESLTSDAAFQGKVFSASSDYKENAAYNLNETKIEIDIKEEHWWLERALTAGKAELEEPPEPAHVKIEDNASRINGVNAELPAQESERLCTEARSGVASICTNAALESSLKMEETVLDNESKHVAIELSQAIDHTCSLNCSERYTDEVCVKNFNSASPLEQHLFPKEISPFKCKVCDKSFILESRLKKHVLSHESKRGYMCEICGKVCRFLSNLKMHKLLHEGKKLHECSICSKAFLRKSYLKVHLSAHEGLRSHKCNICSKAFMTKSYLKTHLSSHEGLSAYKCDICQKTFTRASNLKNHNFIHEGRRPYKCESCEKSFIRESHLKKHCLIHEDKRNTCEICGKSFVYLSVLKTHMFVHEGKRYCVKSDLVGQNS